ncbi:DGQHR domain-containing protein [Peribacillus frigoritolerans]|uniref:DGQHR domain-containing protein n=1 Tax=Peribacillus frigoritolerans TaxID=450367 RepID=UPI003D2A8C35
MKSIDLKVEKVIQPIGEFYITQIDSKSLYSMAKADIMRISNSEDTIYEGIQRELDFKKVEKIENYLRSKEATFPNSIILNLNKNHLIELNDDIMKIRITENTFSIIDGQHRLEGLRNFEHKFGLSCSIFVGLSINEQSRIFVTINSEQTKVNSSVSVYQEYEDTLYTPRKFAAELAVAFAMDKESKWFETIKLRGVKDEISERGTISLSAFYRPILDLIYSDDDYYEIRTLLQDNNNSLREVTNHFHYNLKYEDSNKYILWELYTENNKKLLYKILNNYFDSFAEVLSKDWDLDNNKSILKKTTGYNAMMMLFKDLYFIGFKNGTLTKEFFMTYIEKLKVLNGKVSSGNFEASGLQSSRNMYLKFKELIFNGKN